MLFRWPSQDRRVVAARDGLPGDKLPGAEKRTPRGCAAIPPGPLDAAGIGRRARNCDARKHRSAVARAPAPWVLLLWRGRNRPGIGEQPFLAAPCAGGIG